MQEQNEIIQGQASEIERLKYVIQLRDNTIATFDRIKWIFTFFFDWHEFEN